MRSLRFFGTSKEMRSSCPGAAVRPEALRRRTLTATARLFAVAATLATPFAVWSAVTGAALPLIVVLPALTGALLALALGRRGWHEAAAGVQVQAIMGLGVVLTLLDPRVGDAGLAMMLMGPVLAALVAGPFLRRQSWIVLGVTMTGTVAASLVGWGGQGSVATQNLAALCFFIVMAVVAFAATRMSLAYQVYDKAQVSAYQHLIEHVHDAMIRFSPEGEVLMASRSTETLLGCKRFELSGNGLKERVHVADRPAFLTAFADANRDGKSRAFEARLRRDGEGSGAVPHYVWMEVSFSPVGEDGAERFDVVALLRDITERKDSEAEMARARRLAEEASVAKTRFLATIGHELRTPLNAVVGFSEMMTSGIGGELSPTHREYAGLIHQSGKHLLEVVRMLLDMGRIEAGKFELQAEPFNAAGLMQPCLAMVEPLARERGVELVADVAPNLPLLLADERACRQILINLLTNAVKFSHEGGTVTVSIRRQGQALNLTVADTGIGMTPDSVRRIGEPFFQAQDGLARAYEGTGLGLSIVKGLVDLHGGTLRALSEEGSGTSMTVLLPVNGPAIKSEETGTVTPLYREPIAPSPSSWQNEKRKAQ